MSNLTQLEFSRLPIPALLLAEHEAMSGRLLRRWVAAVSGHFLRVMAAREPIGRAGARLWHISISVAGSPDCSQLPIRRPTDEEVREASRLVSIAGSWSEQESAGLVRHLYEKAIE